MRLSENGQYCIANTGAIIIILLMIFIIITPSILQPALATTVTDLSANATITTANDTGYSSFILVPSNQSTTSISSSVEKTNVTLRGLFNVHNDPGNWNHLLQPALDELNRRHPDMNIGLEYTEFFYPGTRNQILDRLSKGESVDIISVDQIWLGEFAQRGLIENLTQKFEEWGRISDLYEPNLDGCVYNGSLYALWLWTDVRGMWYWKDMLQEAGVDPESLKTWEGYISAAVKLNDFFGDRITQGVHLVGASHDPDMWYPYLWMLAAFPRESWPTLEQEVGFIPMFPVPNQTIQTSTMMGGWELAIPSTSQNSDLAWELITILAQPEILGPFLREMGFLPTLRTLGEGQFSEQSRESIPYFDEMVSMIPDGRSRPNIPEYTEIAEHIHQAIQQVYNGSASPKDALDMAAAKSADSLGWK